MLLPDPTPIFDGGMLAVTEGPGWRVWRPTDPPWPAPNASMSCHNGSMRFSAKMKLQPQSMCLASGDLISNRILTRGRWYDCGRYIRLWNVFTSSNAIGDGMERSKDEGVLLEVGANIGACTLEMLVRTRARIVAFEPSEANLFYLTRTLKLAAERDPSVANRVLVFPLGAGEAWSRTPIFLQPGNLGNSVLRRPFTDGCSGGPRQVDACARRTMRSGGDVLVAPVDAIFPNGLGNTRVFKIDTQGFECNVLRGSQNALSRSVQLKAIVAEVATGWLAAQCCGQMLVWKLLQNAQPGWETSCTPRVGPDSLCIGYGPTSSRVSTAVKRCRFNVNRSAAMLQPWARRMLADENSSARCEFRRQQGIEATRRAVTLGA